MARRDLLDLKVMGFNMIRFIWGGAERYQLDLCDEIGLMVTHIDDKGFLYFQSIGGFDTTVLPGQRVIVRGEKGTVPPASSSQVTIRRSAALAWRCRSSSSPRRARACPCAA